MLIWEVKYAVRHLAEYIMPFTGNLEERVVCSWRSLIWQFLDAIVTF
jgi:hypothetical protein